MYLLHAINSDRQTRLLNALEQIAIYWEGEKESQSKGSNGIFHPSPAPHFETFQVQGGAQNVIPFYHPIKIVTS